ncbi:hypothetical protein SADO_01955 [Salinisphaera dokdonensis CL-ES53]|uniref:Uncharacterized protein n=1 Tax=Salinisphaera dokdonensis CL-ES53 TaxID=1304272 RepID=A0ABV2AWF5_9GAMM
MTKNMTGWETLESDDTRGHQILGREVENGWEIEVRFDNNAEPRRPAADRMPKTREEAIMTGQELAKMG